MSDTAERLTGAWSLVDWTVSFDDGRPSVSPFGEGATGRIHYAPDGIMNAIIMAPGHADTPLRDGKAWVNILIRYMHYSGRWRIEDGAAVHSVDYAVDPALIGRELVRTVTFEGDDLVLRGSDSSPRTGSAIHHELRWRRCRG